MIEGDGVDLEGEEGRNSDGEGFSEECGGGIEDSGIHSSSEECIPPDENMIQPRTIPAVLKWTREVLNLSQVREIAIPASRRIENQEAVTTAVDYCKVRVAWAEGKRVSVGSKRFWENVTRFASTLLNNATVADNIFDAMSHNPDSVLVYSGLSLLFGEEKKIGTRKIGSLFPSTNMIAEFDSEKENPRLANSWYETRAFPRVQEMAIHMTATAEYIHSCAYRAVRKRDTRSA